MKELIQYFLVLESDGDRNLRRVSYLQATKDERMDTEEK